MNFFCEPYGCKMTRRACGARHLVAVGRAANKRMAGDANGATLQYDRVRKCVDCEHGREHSALAHVKSAPKNRWRKKHSKVGRVLEILRSFDGPIKYGEVMRIAVAEGINARGALHQLKLRGDAITHGWGVWEAVRERRL